MERSEGIIHEMKPIWHAYVFELKAHWKKFLVFCSIIALIAFFFGFFFTAMFPDDSLADSQVAYFRDSLGFLTMIIYFGACFFFGGIICSEYKEKTGYLVFPKINRYKLIVGKFLGNLTYLIATVAVYYLLNLITSIYYYGLPLSPKLLMSFTIAILFVLAVSSFVTLFSSLMKSVSTTIILCILLFMIGFGIIELFVNLYNPEIEPLYSLDYLSRLISYVFEEDFPTKKSERYQDFKEGRTVVFRMWLTPTKEMGISMMLVYTGVCLFLAALRFNKRQL